ncbi:MAG TPA: hypothetical protein VJU87_04650 [Gemmatimonadaceae bacterium]|nr:hypothetical protein [Gemmatimonadaceae bacterium]
MRRALGLFVLACSPALLAGCNDTNSPAANAKVSMQDKCDPATFNAGIGPGTCTGSGTVTLSAFNNELNATHRVAAWQFVPAALTIHVGQAITAVNDGGEVHTFTEVAQFGGGEVPSLNSASGTPNEAPECKQLTAADHVAAGASFTTDVATTAETELYQCCIHPWMHAVVTVTP